ncbi:hypothetical protein HYC85_009314 [Camellia sinensis]|uniref:Uncharacterized protein n=1 Tax=Camellia sinensis TaxID=4442 RepID=A0A7J7HEM3_CAMSI|nr:hypothetical protein HYC85_009314 [Camellia sinensis]
MEIFLTEKLTDWIATLDDTEKAFDRWTGWLVVKRRGLEEWCGKQHAKTYQFPKSLKPLAPSFTCNSILYDRTAFLFLFFPSLLLVLRSWLWGGCLSALSVQLYQAWLLILYTGLALRENILRVNGSDIRPWWIKHHYFTMAMALISLTWETQKQTVHVLCKEGCNCSFNGLSCKELQCFYKIDINDKDFVHILHSARRMDVVWGETAGVDGQLWLLAPILFILQILGRGMLTKKRKESGFEAYVGILLLKAALAGVVFEWQVVTCGVLLIVMAIGNFANIVQTLVAKSRFKAKMKKTKHKLELN